MVCVYLIWFVFVRVVGNQGYVWRKCIHWKIFEQIGYGKTYLHVFLMTMHEIDRAAEVHFKHIWLSSVIDNWHGSKYSSQLKGENIWYYNKDENRAHPSSVVQVRHWIDNGSN